MHEFEIISFISGQVPDAKPLSAQVEKLNVCVIVLSAGVKNWVFLNLIESKGI